jgi:hypothetical protein
MIQNFDGRIEERTKPKKVSGEKQLQYADEYEQWKAVGNKDGAAGDPSKVHGVKRKSILYMLPYWKVSKNSTISIC